MSTELKHYGVRGMKWGVRKDKRQSHEDHITARKLGKKQLHELSNAELKRYSERIRLEQEYKKLSAGKVEKGKKFLAKESGKLTGKITEQTYQALANRVAPFVVAGLIAAGKYAIDFYKKRG